jgi:hypothetical protein
VPETSAAADDSADGFGAGRARSLRVPAARAAFLRLATFWTPPFATRARGCAAVLAIVVVLPEL